MTYEYRDRTLFREGKPVAFLAWERQRRPSHYQHCAGMPMDVDTVGRRVAQALAFVDKLASLKRLGDSTPLELAIIDEAVAVRDAT